MSARRVAVIGGGIAGLAATHRLLERASGADAPSEVVLLEATARLGGTIATEHAGGFTIEAGADSFITEKPWALALCDRLGIRDRLVGTRDGGREALRRRPRGAKAAKLTATQRAQLPRKGRIPEKTPARRLEAVRKLPRKGPPGAELLSTPRSRCSLPGRSGRPPGST